MYNISVKYFLFFLLLTSFFVQACSSNDSSPNISPTSITVNSIEDIANPTGDTVTLRSALASAVSGQVIDFDPSLNGSTIELSITGEEHTTLKGEVMSIENGPNGPVSVLEGYFNRDYGKSALYYKRM
jgi:hypothetical protein